MLADTPGLVYEAQSVLRESIYQLQKALGEVEKRWPMMEDEAGRESLRNWLQTTNIRLAKF